MSATPAPDPVPPAYAQAQPPRGFPQHSQPVRQSAPPAGCLPFTVFVLTAAGIAGLIAQRCGCLPKEDAGRTVVEILNSPTRAEMKAHVRRVLSGEVTKRAAKLAFDASDPVRVQEEREERIRENLEVTAEGPFITITIFDRLRSPAGIANAVAKAYDEYLKERIEEDRRRRNQALQAHITLGESAAEKARLEWIELSKRLGFSLEPKSVNDAAAANEIAARLAKARAEIVVVESRAAGMKEDDPAKASTVAEAQALRAIVSQFKAVAAEMDTEGFRRDQVRSEVDYAKEKYDRLRDHLNRMRQEVIDRSLEQSVVLLPMRVTEEARPVRVPDRRIRGFVRMGVAACAGLVAALFLAALASRLCRRSA